MDDDKRQRQIAYRVAIEVAFSVAIIKNINTAFLSSVIKNKMIGFHASCQLFWANCLSKLLDIQASV